MEVVEYFSEDCDNKSYQVLLKKTRKPEGVKDAIKAALLREADGTSPCHANRYRMGKVSRSSDRRRRFEISSPEADRR